jgi:hypothetical protein
MVGAPMGGKLWMIRPIPFVTASLIRLQGRPFMSRAPDAHCLLDRKDGGIREKKERSGLTFFGHILDDLRAAKGSLVVAQAMVADLTQTVDKHTETVRKMRDVLDDANVEVTGDVAEIPKVQTTQSGSRMLPHSRELTPDSCSELLVYCLKGKQGPTYRHEIYHCFTHPEDSPDELKTLKSKVDYAIDKAVRSGMLVRIGDKKPYRYELAA